MANQKILRYGTAGQWMIVMDGDRGIAPGGFNRQILTKVSGTDYDAQWRDPAGFTFTQGAAPTLGLDGTSALVTGQTWWDTTTGNGYVRVATQWVQFAWGDSEARYVNTTGDTINGQLTLNGGGGDTLELRPGTADHVYIEFFARTANPASRSAYLGFPAAASTTFTIANSLPGDIALSPSTGHVLLNADPTAALHAVTKQYSDLKLLKSGDTMSGILTMNANINMGAGRKIDFTDELGMKLDLYGGSYWLGIASGTLQYASGGSHQFYGQVNTDTHFSAAGSVYANSGRVRMGAWQSAPYAAGWGGLVGSRGYILIDYSDGSGGNMHVRGNNNLYIGGGSTDDMYFSGTGIRSTSNHYFSQGIAVDGGGTISGGLTVNGAATNVNTLNCGRVTPVWSGGGYNEANCFANSPAYGVASNSYHPSGVACQFRMGINNQILYLMGINGGDNNVSFRTYEVYTARAGPYRVETSLQSLGAAAAEAPAIESAVTMDWPLPASKGAVSRSLADGKAPVDPLTVLRYIKPVWTRPDKKAHFKRIPVGERRLAAFHRLNDLRATRGLEPFESEETTHICGRDCHELYSPENPCDEVRDWENGSISFVAEDLAQVFPQATAKNPYTGEDEYINVLSVASLGVAASKVQQDIIDDLLARVEALEAQLASSG